MRREICSSRGVDAHSIMGIAATMSGLRYRAHTLGVFERQILRGEDPPAAGPAGTSLRRARLLLATGLSVLAAYAVIASGGLGFRSEHTAGRDEALHVFPANGFILIYSAERKTEPRGKLR